MWGFMKSYYYGALEFCRSLGLASLSWAYYHTVSSVRETVREHREKTSFLAVLTTLAAVYYGITDVNWDETDIKIWGKYMKQVSEREEEETRMFGGE